MAASVGAVLVGVLAVPKSASAEAATLADAPASSSGDGVHRTFGVSLDVGLPDGAAFGLSVRPAVEWLRVTAAVTHNGLAPGARIGLTVDPIAFPVGPTFTVEGGHAWAGAVPNTQSSASVFYNYANFHLGLEFGNRDSFRVYLRGGVSYVDVHGADAPLTSLTEAHFGNPSYDGWLAPSAKLGFSLYF